MTNSTTLGKALPIKYGKSRNENYGYVAESAPVYGSSGVIGEFNRALTTGPALIVGRKGSAGSVHYSATPCWPIDTVYYAETPPDSTLHFFRYLLEHLRLGQHDKSTAIPSLGRDDYNAVPVSVPSLAKQEQVVAYLDEQLSRLDASVTALHRVQANLKRYRASVLKAACEGRLVPTEAELAHQEGRDFETGAQLLQRILVERRERWTGRGKYKEPRAASPSEQFLVRDGWGWASGEALFEWSSGMNLTEKDFVAGEIPVYGGNGVSGLHSVHNIQHDTLVVGRVGAQCGNVHMSRGHAWITDNAIYSRSVPSLMCLAFAAIVFSCENLNKKAAGSGQPFVNQKMLNAVPVPLPPLPEQHRIVAEADRRLSLIRAAEATVAANLARAQRLRQSILQAAFSA